MKLPVLIAAGGADWEAGLVSAFERADHGVLVVRRCVDVAQLLGLAASGKARAALVSAGLRRLDADAVDRLSAADVVVVAVVAPGPQRGAEARTDTRAETENRLRAMGIRYLVAADAAPEVVAAVVTEAVRATAAQAPAGPARAFADPARLAVLPPAPDAVTATGPAGAGPDRRGSVLAVWGPTGAPGRTTVAVTLADELARLRRSVLLVDADVYGATVAAVLGLLDESPGLAAACRAAGTGRLDAVALAALCWQLNPALRVLTGMPIAARWPELRPAALSGVLAAARRLADFVVVDCGFCLESDEELSYDTHAPRRNGATLSVLDEADAVLAVGSADPIGMQRLVRALGDFGDLRLSAPVQVVLNRVRGSAVPGDAVTELRAALERFSGHRPAAFLPFDMEALDAALASGRTLAECRSASPLRQAVAEFAARLAGVPQASSRHRRR